MIEAYNNTFSRSICYLHFHLFNLITMKTTSIQIPSQTIYLSEALNNTLPKSCLLNRGKVCAGGTNIEPTSEEDYAIAVPYLALIQNNLSQSF